MFTQKKWVFTFSLLKIQQKCSSYSCCTELASGDCQGKKNPIIQFVGCCPLQKTELF